MGVTIVRNIETFPSKQMYPYLSLVERKGAEFYHNIDRRRFGLVEITYFLHFFQTTAGVLTWRALEMPTPITTPTAIPTIATTFPT